MFGSAKEKLNFTCEHDFKFRNELSFGWNCVTPIKSYLKDLAKQLGIKSRKDLPTCDVICRDFGDRQLSYDDFELTLDDLVLTSLL